MTYGWYSGTEGAATGFLGAGWEQESCVSLALRDAAGTEGGGAPEPAKPEPSPDGVGGRAVARPAEPSPEQPVHPEAPDGGSETEGAEAPDQPPSELRAVESTPRAGGCNVRAPRADGALLPALGLLLFVWRKRRASSRVGAARRVA